MDPGERASGSLEPATALVWYSCFAFLLAAALLIHQLHENQFAAGGWLDAILDVAALWTLLRPSSVLRLLLLCGAQLALFWSEMPFVWSHWVFLALVDVSLLATAASLALAHRRRIAAAELFTATAPALRLALVLLYFFAALAKLNPAYLDPRQSCAVTLYHQLADFWPWVPSGVWAETLSIWTSLGIECALPFALLFPPTRVPALFLGGAFHVLLGIPQRYDFSAAMLPFYCLFVPPECWRFLAGRASRWRESDPGRGIARLAGSAAALPILAALLLAIRYAGPVLTAPQSVAVGKVLWLILCAAAGALLLVALRQRQTAGQPAPMFRGAATIAMIGPLLITLTGISPYLGLNTERAFTMFSNLRTEGDRWNHFFLPRGLRVFHFQDEIYAVVSSSDPELRKRAQRRESLVRFELQRQMSEDPDAAITFVADGQRRQLAHALDDPELSAPLSPALAKLFWFRPVPQRDTCVH